MEFEILLKGKRKCIIQLKRREPICKVKKNENPKLQCVEEEENAKGQQRVLYKTSKSELRRRRF